MTRMRRDRWRDILLALLELLAERVALTVVGRAAQWIEHRLEQRKWYRSLYRRTHWELRQLPDGTREWMPVVRCFAGQPAGSGPVVIECEGPVVDREHAP